MLNCWKKSQNTECVGESLPASGPSVGRIVIRSEEGVPRREHKGCGTGAWARVNGVTWSQEHNADKTTAPPALWGGTFQSVQGLSNLQSTTETKVGRNHFDPLLMTTDSEG